MKRWEYIYLYASHKKGTNMVTNINENLVEDKDYELGSVLNQLGSEGWELVGLTGIGETGWRFVLKRPLEDEGS
jgi:hypothetical protein